MKTTNDTKKAAPRKKPVSDLATTVMAAIAIALPLMLYLREHVEILRYGYQIEALKQQDQQLRMTARELEARRAEAASLPTVEARATAMGLVAPHPEDVFVATGEDAAVAVPQQPIPIQARLE